MNDAIGIMWVPEDLSNDIYDCKYSQYYYIINISIDAAEPKKWVLNIRHRAEDYSLLLRWLTCCSNVQLYMKYFDDNWDTVNVKFRNVRPMRLDINNGVLAIVFDEGREFPFMPSHVPYVALPTPGPQQNNRLLVGGHRYIAYQ